MPGVWGKAPSDAIRSPPPPPERSDSGLSRGSSGGVGGGQRARLNRQRSGSGRGGGGGRGGRGRHHNNNHNNNNSNERRNSYRNKNDRNNDNNSNNQTSIFMANVKLLINGDGANQRQKSVKRFTAEQLLIFRLQYLDTPTQIDLTFRPSEHCVWDDPGRMQEIRANHVEPKKTGDVSRTNRRNSPKETAPPLEDCKPLEVNEKTRWKSKVFHNKDGTEQAEETSDDQDSDDEVLKRALLIMNKLSLTKFDKLSTEFVDTGIGRNTDILGKAIGLLVEKAQSEPHFSGMYAQLCLKLSKIPKLGGSSKKVFKKMLLTRCQQEFTTDTKDKIAEATKDLTDKEEIDYHTNLIRKAYVGHMRFIGELYKCDLIKNEIMLWCLQTLLEANEEDNFECFTKLMTTIGYSLEQQTLTLQKMGKDEPVKQLQKCWETADRLCQSGQLSNRVKFMLLDLKEMQQKGWVTRRKEETAKTLAQIHKDVAQEEARARQKSTHQPRGPRRSSSHSNLRPSTDQDGFTTVSVPVRLTPFAVQRATSDSGSTSFPAVPPRATPRRAKSFSVTPSSPPPPPPPPKKTYLPLDQIETKSKNLFKEYFVAGETDDAVLTIDELIGVGKPESVERGAKLIEAAILLVLERKDEDAKKMMMVLEKAWEQQKLDKESFGKSLAEPLEFLSDIEIDAPLAGTILAGIVATFVDKMKALELDHLLIAPDFFLSDGKPALFAAKVLNQMEGETVDSQVAVVEKLMTSKDKENFASAKELIDSIKS